MKGGLATNFKDASNMFHNVTIMALDQAADRADKVRGSGIIIS